MAGTTHSLARINMKLRSQEETVGSNRPAKADAAGVRATSAASLYKERVSLQQLFNELVKRIPPPLQAGMLHVFTELLQLLTYVGLIEDDITQERDLRRTITIFKVIHTRALALIDKINVLATNAHKSEEALGEALEGTGFALKHELRRVFEGSGLSQGTTQAQTQFSRSKLTRAYGLLHNCFQQSTITLAQVFDPTLNGNVLFEDHKLRQEQSITLYRELTLLLQKVRRVESGAGILQKLYFINSLKQFQQETMHFLMHRDWAEFENFVNEVIKTYDEAGDLGPVFHRFSGYLETLLNHVSMRAVLIDKPLCPTGMIF